MNSVLDILTLVYGESHVELFRRTALKSLAQPKNKAVIYDSNARWNICTDDKFYDYLSRTIDIYFPELTVNFISRSDLRDYIDPIQSAIIWQAKESVKHGRRVLLAPPDTIFSDGTIEYLVLECQKQGDVVVVPHPRANPELLNEDYLCSSFELVDLTWRHLHQSWDEAEDGHEFHNSFVGGVRWHREAGNIRKGRHYLPSPYMMRFLEEDVKYFERQISFGSFDHVWPGEMLIPSGRQLYVDDSANAFIVEITDRYKNVPPVWGNPHKAEFWRAGPQLEHNKKIEFTFRGSK